MKTGGLGDVSSALPLALRRAGVDIRLFIPGYMNVLKNLKNHVLLKTFPDAFGTNAPENAQLLRGTLSNGLAAYVFAAARFYERASPYVDGNGSDWDDNALRFSAFCRVAADLDLYDQTWIPDIIHGQDWQTGLIPAYLAGRRRPRPRTMLTVHNLAYQGNFAPDDLPPSALPQGHDLRGLEHHGCLSFLKAGLSHADHLTTVSPTYAREIQTPAYGCGLDDVIVGRARSLTGILNGIDHDVWNPATDPYLEKRYNARSVAHKWKNKVALLKGYGLPVTKNPLLAVIGRLTPQKGFDLLLEIGPRLAAHKMTLVFLGHGDRQLENDLKALQKNFPEQVYADIEFDEEKEHRLHGGADALIMPSRFEPCGLVQMYGMRYGTIPVVRRTGGLADSVTPAGERTDAATGFAFDEAQPEALEQTLHNLTLVYRNRSAWRRLQENAMAIDNGWAAAAGKYHALYKDINGTPPREPSTGNGG